MRKAGNTALIIFGSVFLIICLFGYLRGSSTANWPTANGESVSIHLERKSNWFTGIERGDSRSAKPEEYETHITYKYYIEGQEYISQAYHINFLGLKSNLKGSLQYLENVLKVHQKYNPGSPINVYYDPDNPSNSLLAKGYQGYMFTYLIFSLIAICFGIYGLIKD